MRKALPISGSRRPRLLGHAAENHLFHARLDFVGQLETVPGKKLDAVVLIRIVRGRDHHARVRAHAAGQKRHPGRRHGPDQQNIGAPSRQYPKPTRSRACIPKGGCLCRSESYSGVCHIRRFCAQMTAAASGRRSRSGIGSCSTLATARPSFSAISEVIGSWLATPRTPSVPKRWRWVCFYLVAADSSSHELLCI